MIAMRDGVKLQTVILVPKGAKHEGILMTRTPYSASITTTNTNSVHLGTMLYGYDNATETILAGGYIRVVQDIRGKYGSEGDYVMNRPMHGVSFLRSREIIRRLRGESTMRRGRLVLLSCRWSRLKRWETYLRVGCSGH
jgi:hypothetical protein